MLELRDLRNLLSLNEHRHFGRAASAVGLSQPALTKSIQRLEKQFGGLLFDRSRSGIVPTMIGEETIVRAKRVVNEVTELQRSVDLLSGLKVGALSLGLGPAMSESYIARALATVAEAHPEVRINLRVDHWQQLSEWLLDNEIDFFVADIAEWAHDDRFDCEPLPAQEFVWFCRTGHPLASRPIVSQRDLLKYPLATPRMPVWAVDWFAAAMSEEERTESTPKPMPNIQCESYSMLKRIVLAGDCVSAALSTTIEEELAEGRLAVLPVDAPKLMTHAGIVRLRGRSSSPLAERVIRIIQSTADEFKPFVSVIDDDGSLRCT